MQSNLKACSLALIPVMLALLVIPAATAEERFPPPDFGPEYRMPHAEEPPPDGPWTEWLDVAVLAGALSLASWLALRSRSRRGLLLLTIFSLVYFGFWRKGCICPIGAIQNVTLALFDPSYLLPLGVAAFFFLPIGFTLFFGRTFCSSVCPLGAAQDLVLVRPVRVPSWLDHGMRVAAYAYLGLAVLFAATASSFIICEYDPFVPFFRLSGSSGRLLLGAAFLVVGLVVGRPYCRFFCPYGVLLGVLSRFSKWGVTITPDSCVQCRLCEEECPFGAIAIPDPARPSSSAPRLARTLLILAIILPCLVLAGAGLGALSAGALSRMHRVVRLAERIQLEDASLVEGKTEASAAFRATGRPFVELRAEALAVRDRFRLGAPILGAFLGLVIGVKLIQSVWPRRGRDYEVHRSTCVSCGRCFFYCPQEHNRLKSRGVTISPEDVSRQL